MNFENLKSLDKEEELKEEVANLAESEIIKENPEEVKELLMKVMHSQSIQRSGPLPSPDDLEHYNAIIPNGADRIMKMAEIQLEHRHFLERKVVAANNTDSRLGQIFGFVLALICLGSSVYLAMNNKEVVAGVLATTTIIGLATVFVLGKKYQLKNNESEDDSEE